MHIPLPLVSIIMPCYNAAAYLQQSVESVLKQSYPRFELIIVNDGSIDDSEKIISHFKDERIRYLYQQNKGQCYAANYGLSKATGDYIKFFDADDIMNPTHIQALITTINGSETAIGSCSWAAFYDNNLSTAVFTPEPNWKNLPPLEWIKLSMDGTYDMMPAWLWLIPKKVLQITGGWDERLSLNNDFEFSIRLLLNSSAVLFSEEAKIFYRSGQQSSLSATLSESAYKAAMLSAKLGCTQLLEKENSPATKLLCANKFSYWLYQVFPAYPSLVKELEHEIKLLGGTNRKIDESPLMHKLQQIIGWKNAKQLKILLYKIGYKKYLLKIKKKLFPPSISRN